MMPPVSDLLDGCALDFTENPDDDMTQAMRPLFPDGDPSKRLEWEELFFHPHTRRPRPKKHRIRKFGFERFSLGNYDVGIADRLRAAGLKVVEVEGWKTRGSGTFSPRGSVDHHTAGSRLGNAPSLGICINGRPDLPGPLCNVLIGRDNTCYVIAAGRANHAGTGGWAGLSGNSSVYGVERENIGTSAEPWREDQTDTAARCHAALIQGRANETTVCEHKDWTSRKIDAHTITGTDMRTRVRKYCRNEPAPTPSNPAYFPTYTDEELEDMKPMLPYQRGDKGGLYAVLPRTMLPQRRSSAVGMGSMEQLNRLMDVGLVVRETRQGFPTHLTLPEAEFDAIFGKPDEMG